MVYIWRLSAAPWSKHILEWPKWFFLTGPRLLIWISMWADRRFHLHWPLTAGMWYNLYVSGMTSSSIRGMINQYLNLEYRNWTDSLNRIWSTWFYWSNLIRISFFSFKSLELSWCPELSTYCPDRPDFGRGLIAFWWTRTSSDSNN